MRILYPFVGDTVGGSHVSTVTLIKNLPPEYTPLIVLHRPGRLQDYLMSQGLSWEMVSTAPARQGNRLSELIDMLRASAALTRYLKGKDIDVVHTNDRRMHVTWALAARCAGAKFIWHQRTAIVSRKLAYLISILANRRLAVSKACVIRGMGRVDVIDNPVAAASPAPVRAEARHRLLTRINAPQDSVIVGWVANWAERKRPLFLVDVAAHFKRMVDRPVRIVMVGERPSEWVEPTARRVKGLGLDEDVVVMGSQWPIEPFLAACDVLAATAVQEGLGRTLIEAMLVGTPVVATADAGHLEIIQDGENGRLVAIDDQVGFASSLADICKDPELARSRATTAKTFALERFSVARHVRQITNVYAELLDA